MARRRKRQLVISAEVHPAPETPTQKQQLPVCEPLTLESAHFWFKRSLHVPDGPLHVRDGHLHVRDGYLHVRDAHLDIVYASLYVLITIPSRPGWTPPRPGRITPRPRCPRPHQYAFLHVPSTIPPRPGWLPLCRICLPPRPKRPSPRPKCPPFAEASQAPSPSAPLHVQTAPPQHRLAWSHV